MLYETFCNFISIIIGHNCHGIWSRFLNVYESSNIFNASTYFAKDNWHLKYIKYLYQKYLIELPVTLISLIFKSVFDFANIIQIIIFYYSTNNVIIVDIKPYYYFTRNIYYIIYKYYITRNRSKLWAVIYRYDSQFIAIHL